MKNADKCKSNTPAVAEMTTLEAVAVPADDDGLPVLLREAPRHLPVPGEDDLDAAARVIDGTAGFTSDDAAAQGATATPADAATVPLVAGTDRFYLRPDAVKAAYHQWRQEKLAKESGNDHDGDDTRSHRSSSSHRTSASVSVGMGLGHRPRHSQFASSMKLDAFRPTQSERVKAFGANVYPVLPTPRSRTRSRSPSYTPYTPPPRLRDQRVDSNSSSPLVATATVTADNSSPPRFGRRSRERQSP